MTGERGMIQGTHLWVDAEGGFLMLPREEGSVDTKMKLNIEGVEATSLKDLYLHMDGIVLRGVEMGSWKTQWDTSMIIGHQEREVEHQLESLHRKMAAGIHMLDEVGMILH